MGCFQRELVKVTGVSAQRSSSSASAVASGIMKARGLVVKAGIVDLIGDDRATILGALLWMADKLKSDQRERARALWAAKGKEAFDADAATHKRTGRTV